MFMAGRGTDKVREAWIWLANNSQVIHRSAVSTNGPLRSHNFTWRHAKATVVTELFPHRNNPMIQGILAEIKNRPGNLEDSRGGWRSGGVRPKGYLPFLAGGVGTVAMVCRMRLAILYGSPCEFGRRSSK